MKCHIVYLGQSGWLIETPDKLLLFDYWKGGLPASVEEADKPLLVFISHKHGDHFNKKVFDLNRHPSSTHFVLSDDVPCPPPGSLLLKEGASVCCEELTIKAYGSTDAGVSFVVRHPRFTIFHAGDYNLWHWPLESTAEEIAEAEAWFYRILDNLAVEQIDMAFFPVDSRQKEDYDRGARIFAARCAPRYFFPMHFGEDWQAPQHFAAWAARSLPVMKVFAPSPKKECFEITL